MWDENKRSRKKKYQKKPYEQKSGYQKRGYKHGRGPERRKSKPKISLTNELFVNPYTFIPLEKEPIRSKYDINRRHQGKNKSLTGWIECKLTTKTPLFIPNITKDQTFNEALGWNSDVKSHDFYSYTDLSKEKNILSSYQMPIIPGSEIRGMIRQAFETVTNSCLSSIDKEKYLYKHTSRIGKYSPCTELSSSCPACQLFGFVSNIDSLGSRLRFTDATVILEKDRPLKDLYFEPVILPELSSPKPSSTEFYLVKPEGINRDGFWNYDYAIKYRVKNNQTVKYSETRIHGYKAIIRGRKYYWHHSRIEKPPAIENKSSSKRNTGIRALKRDISFSFRVFFQNITEKELNQLCWVLEIGNEKKHYHKLGRGKPLGLGSVIIKITNVKLRKISLEKDMIRKNYNDGLEFVEKSRQMNHGELAFNETTLQAFLKVTKFDTISGKISYPVNAGSDKSYEWFVSNRKIPPGTEANPIIKQCLPEILVADQSLKKYKEKSGKRY